MQGQPRGVRMCSRNLSVTWESLACQSRGRGLSLQTRLRIAKQHEHEDPRPRDRRETPCNVLEDMRGEKATLDVMSLEQTYGVNYVRSRSLWGLLLFPPSISYNQGQLDNLRSSWQNENMGSFSKIVKNFKMITARSKPNTQVGLL